MFKLPDAIADFCREHNACVSGSVMLEAMGHKLPSGEPFRATKYSIYIDSAKDLTGLFDTELEEYSDEWDFEDIPHVTPDVECGTLKGHVVTVHPIDIPTGANIEEIMDAVIGAFDVPCIRGYFGPDGVIHTTIDMNNAIATAAFSVHKIRLHRLFMYQKRGFAITYRELDEYLTITEDTRREIIDYLSTNKPSLIYCFITCTVGVDDLIALQRAELLNFYGYRPNVNLIDHPRVMMFNIDIDCMRFGPKTKNLEIYRSTGTIHIARDAYCTAKNLTVIRE